jgi:hypothetical protein
VAGSSWLTQTMVREGMTDPRQICPDPAVDLPTHAANRTYDQKKLTEPGAPAVHFPVRRFATPSPTRGDTGRHKDGPESHSHLQDQRSRPPAGRAWSPSHVDRVSTPTDRPSIPLGFDPARCEEGVDIVRVQPDMATDL